MRKLVLCTLMAGAMAWSAPALAQASKPGAVNPPTATTGSAAKTTEAATGLKVGLPVKDSAGATIGKVTDLQTDASGRQMATIGMGADAVSVEADKLTAKGGAASINMTHTQLKSMAKKPPS